MAPGEYESGTQTPEVMRVISGELVVLLPEASAWETFSAGQAFTVPAGRNFQLRVAAPASYLCLYGS